MPDIQNDPNTQQVGGKHYVAEYQHWDLVADTNMGYFPAQITKYVCRWRSKEGLRDVEKANHYCAKLIHLVLTGRKSAEGCCDLGDEKTAKAFRTYVEHSHLTRLEESIFELCINYSTMDDLMQLKSKLEQLLDAAKSSPYSLPHL